MFSLWRRVALPVVSAVGCCVLASPVQAQDATTLYSCNGFQGTYELVGGAPIWLRSPEAAGYTSSTQPVPQPIDCVQPVPADGAVAQSTVNGQAQHSFVVVGGAPIEIVDWNAFGGSQPPGMAYFDQASLPPPAGDDDTQPGGFPLAGYFSTVARTRDAAHPSYFQDEATKVVYRLDSIGHPSPVASASAGAALPVIPDAAVQACTRMNCDPWGPVTVEPAGNGLLHLYGYALDGMTSQQLTVRVDLPGGSVTIPADQPDPEVGALYGRSGNYGFNRVISAPAGHYQACVTFNGFAPGATYTPVGCFTVDVPGAKPARVHRPKVKAIGGHRLRVTWKVPNDGGSPISEYLLRTSNGVKKQIAGTKHSIVLKHLPGGRRMTVKVRAINGVGAGSFSKPSHMVVVH